MNELLIKQARSANLVDYFRSKGYELEEHSTGYFVKNVQGLCITPSGGRWFSHYRNIGGTNAINCLTRLFGYDFKKAITELTGVSISESPPPMSERIEAVEGVVLPTRADDEKRVIAYLHKTRLIPYAVIKDFIKQGKLYQEYENSNAVFLHMKYGKVVGGEVHGTTDIRFKGIVKGTRNSVFAWRCSAVLSRAYVFESVIDLMSFIALHNQSQLDGCVLLSLGGTKELLFDSIASDIRAKGIEIFSCVDNDEEGQKFERNTGLQRAFDVLERNGVKDWNELLTEKRGIT
jgi:hypothetical protein